MPIKELPSGLLRINHDTAKEIALEEMWEEGESVLIHVSDVPCLIVYLKEWLQDMGMDETGAKNE